MYGRDVDRTMVSLAIVPGLGTESPRVLIWSTPHESSIIYKHESFLASKGAFTTLGRVDILSGSPSPAQLPPLIGLTS